jgi:hypothetical protein
MAKVERPRDVVTVFSGRIAEADLLKFLLEEAGIRCWLDNESFDEPPVSVRLLVAQDDAGRAREAIQRSREDETQAE